MEVRQLSAEDLEQVLDLWQGAEGIGFAIPSNTVDDVI